jgi:hypothetical protein
MSTPTKKPFRKRHLFARTVSDVVKEATKPLMSKQGKLYGALLRDWSQIVGAERAAVTRPERLQFMHAETSGAILHLHARPSAAPELAYMHEQMLEQCARYFGYRAIERIVIHATQNDIAGFGGEQGLLLAACFGACWGCSRAITRNFRILRIKTITCGTADQGH